MGMLSKLKIPKGAVIGLGILIIALIAVVVIRSMPKGEQEMPVYTYNEIEQQLADAVITYINECVVFPEIATAQIANEAVHNYRLIISSDVDIVNDDHTAAVKERIKAAFVSIAEADSQIDLSEDNRDKLSAGIAGIVWSTILSQIESVTKYTDLESEYYYLAESIQGQIDKLEEQKMKVSIRANIKNNMDLSPEELLAMVEGMTDEELREFLNSLGLSYDEFYDLLASANGSMSKELETRLETLKKELLKELTKELSSSATNGTSGTSGTSGAGKDGQNGKDGKDGQAGKDGSNGKATYIAYADDSSGSNFSLTPLETSKYIGTCITDATKQPTDKSSYGNWQLYRSHIITDTTDEDGVTTVHIY